MKKVEIKKEIVRELMDNWEEIKEYLINTYQSTLEDSCFEDLVIGSYSLDGLQEMANIIGRLDEALDDELTEEELVEDDIIDFSDLSALLNDLCIGYNNDAVPILKKIDELLKTLFA